MRVGQDHAKRLLCIDFYLASAEYWIHFTAHFGGVHAFGYNSAESEPILDEIWITLEYTVGGWPLKILCVICAVATAGNPGEFF